MRSSMLLSNVANNRGVTYSLASRRIVFGQLAGVIGVLVRKFSYQVCQNTKLPHIAIAINTELRTLEGECNIGQNVRSRRRSHNTIRSHAST